MTRHTLHPRTALIALALTLALASCTLTACGSSAGSTPPAQAPQLTPQQAAARHLAVVEMVNCARRHGIHLPPATEQGVNVSGVKGHRNEVAMGHCYHNALKQAARRAKAEQAETAEQGSSPPYLSGEEPSG